MTFKQFFTYGLVGMLVILIIVMALAPSTIKNYVNKNGKELTGRVLHIDKLRVNYFSSTVQVFGFSFFEKDGVTEFLGFDTLKVNLKPLRLVKDELHIQQLLLANPRGVILQNDTVFNFSDLIKETNTIEVEDTGQVVPYKLNLNQLEMRNGNFTYKDEVLDDSININSLSFHMPQIYWNASHSSSADLAFNMSEGGQFKSGLNYKADVSNYSGFAHFNGLELSMFLPHIQQQMNLSDLGGTFDMNMQFSGSLNDNKSLSLKGEMAIHNLWVSDVEGDTIAGVGKHLMVFNEIKPFEQKIIIDTVGIESPFASLVIIDSLTNNWSKIMVGNRDTAVVEDSTEMHVDTVNVVDGGFKVSVHDFYIRDGRFSYKDLQFDTTFVFDITDFEVDMDSVQSGGSWIDLQSAMTLNHKGKLEADLGLNPNAPKDSFKLTYVLSNMPLMDFDLYSRQYLGYRIMGGTLFFTGKTTISKNYLESKNQLNIRDIDMGDKEGGEYDVPVKTALFIAKDNNNDVQMDIPLEGNLADTNTSIGGLIAKTLSDFVFKIIKSPFKILGSIVGVDAGEMSNIPFEYDDVEKLSEMQKKSLDAVVKFAQKRADLKIELSYFNDKTLERQVIAKSMAQANYENKYKMKAERNEAAYQQYLESKIKTSGLSIEELEWELSPQNKINRMVEKREQTRLKMVQNYLKDKEVVDLVKLNDYDESNASNAKSIPRIEASIGLNTQK